MFQELITTTQNAENVSKAISFGAIGWNIGLMLLGSILCLSGYAFKTKDTPVATMPWIKENVRRFICGGILVMTLAIAMAVVPDQLAAVLSLLAIDAKNVAAPFLLGVGFGFLLITLTSEPSKNPEGK